MIVIRCLVCLAIVLIGSGMSTAADAPPERAALIRFHRYRLADPDYRWFHAEHLVALARLADPAVVPSLIDELEDPSFRLRLIALWGLARIDTPRARILAAAHQPGIRQRLLEPFDEEIAFRSAFLARANRSPEGLRRLNATLPTLYNTVRGAERLDERLIAAWALYQIDTPVTVETADRAMTDAARGLTMDQASRSWNLVLIRLLGAPGRRHFQKPLESILADGDFGWDITRDREAILRTLAAMVYPDSHPALEAVLAEIARDLDSVIGRYSALERLAALLPHGCRPTLLRKVRKIHHGRSPDDLEWEKARDIIQGCEAADRD